MRVLSLEPVSVESTGVESTEARLTRREQRHRVQSGGRRVQSTVESILYLPEGFPYHSHSCMPEVGQSYACVRLCISWHPKFEGSLPYSAPATSTGMSDCFE